jgi:hypothetical protein
MNYIKNYINFNEYETEFDFDYRKHIQIGDYITITRQIDRYIKKYHWSDTMYQLIDKKFRVLSVGDFMGLSFGIEYNNTPWKIPYDCII